jgi:hypothetical protein
MKRAPYIDELVQARMGGELDRALARVRDSAIEPPTRGAKLGPPTQPPPPSLESSRPRAQLAALQRVSVRNDERSFAAIQHNARSIDALAKAQAELAERVAAVEIGGRADLLRALAGKLSSLERRIETTAIAQPRTAQVAARSLSATVSRQGQALREQARAAMIQKLSATAAGLENAAYGTKGSPLAKGNLLLAANQLLWSFGPDVLRTLGLLSPAASSKLAWLAPIGSLVTGEVVLGRRQHERFVSGVATNLARSSGLPAPGGVILFSSSTTLSTRVSLRPYIASGAWFDFQRRTDVAVTTSVVSINPDVRAAASVERGVLRLSIAGGGASGDTRIAWIVDTQDPNG